MSVSNVIPLRPSVLALVPRPVSVTVVLSADECRALAFAADLAQVMMPVAPSAALLSGLAELECSLADAGELR